MIVFIRHAEAEKASGRAIGQTDLPLSQNGIKQLQVLKKTMHGAGFSRILCSPLERTMLTAEAVGQACGLSPQADNNLAEINLGEWDGLSFDDIKSQFPDEYEERGKNFSSFRPPQGESFFDLKSRVVNVLEKLNTESKPTLIVTHAGVIRVAMHMALGFSLNDLFKVKPAHCHLTIFDARPKGLMLKGFNLPPQATYSFYEGLIPDCDQYGNT
jgi:probable phosphoglycerate mutase